MAKNVFIQIQKINNTLGIQFWSLIIHQNEKKMGASKENKRMTCLENLTFLGNLTATHSPQVFIFYSVNSSEALNIWSDGFFFGWLGFLEHP